MRGSGPGPSKLPGVNNLKGKDLDAARASAFANRTMRLDDARSRMSPAIYDGFASYQPPNAEESPESSAAYTAAKKQQRMEAKAAQDGMGRKKRTKRVKRSKRKTHRR